MAERALRGSRLGAVSYENELATDLAERQVVAYVCPNGHHLDVPLAAEAEVPATWECRFCGATASLADATAASSVVSAVRTKPPRSHWDMLLERRSIPELELILEERLELLRLAGRRKTA
jgi:RNA polymerase-binding protein